jgi:N-acetylneuraminic acid mutarotase
MFRLRNLLATLALVWGARADVPHLITYQGRLAVGGSAFEGTGQFKFALISPGGVETYWRNSPDADSDGQPDAPVALAVSKGLYSAQLGDTSLAAMSALLPSVFTNASVFLRVWFNDGVNGFQRLSPDQRVSAVGYALMAADVADGAITLAKLAPETVTAINAGGIDIGAFLTTLAGLSNQVAALSNQVKVAAPSGLSVVSADASDATLLGLGYAKFSSVPASAWASGASAGSPSARYQHAAVWTGAEWITWGGNGGSGFMSATGGRYDPWQDRWTTASTINAPSARRSHTAVWTGIEMMVWGGFSTRYENTGGRFNPETQTWRALSLTGAPSARDGHIAIWTGSRMVIWGGRNDNGLAATAGLYNPTSDQWVALSLAGAPPNATGATAVKAGNRVIIWGGVGEAGPLGSGARLNLDGSGIPISWASVNIVSAPSPRAGHTVVWTGQKMLVWGGERGGVYRNDGAAYDPATDTWQVLNGIEAPAARSNHAAVWTGEEMIVIGGENAAGALAGGAAYNLSTGVWRTLNSSGATARSGSAAAWAATELLVFGGRSGPTPLAALQRLNPQPPLFFYRKP